MAEALDEHEAAEKEAAIATVTAEERRKELEAARASDADSEAIEQKEKALKETEPTARELFRKAAKLDCQSRTRRPRSRSVRSRNRVH